MKQAQTLLHSLSEKLRAACRDEKRRVNLLLAAGLGGMLLLLVSEWFPEEAAVPQTDAAPAATAAPDSYAETLEEQLTEMICRMEGAGQTRVMVTLAGSQLTRYAADTERSADTERRSMFCWATPRLSNRSKPRRSWAWRSSARAAATPACSMP